MPRVQLPAVTSKRKAWNKRRIIGQKRPLLPKQVWAIRARLELAGYLRDLALFNVAIDSKLRGCYLVKLSVTDLVKEDRERVSVIQSKTKRPVQFELTENTRDTVLAWVKSPEMFACRFMFPSRFHDRLHISTRQYGRLVRDWVTSIGLEPSGYVANNERRDPKKALVDFGGCVKAWLGSANLVHSLLCKGFQSDFDTPLGAIPNSGDCSLCSCT